MLTGMFAAKRPLFGDPSTQPYGTPPYAPTPSLQPALGAIPTGAPVAPAPAAAASPLDHVSGWKAALGGLFDSIAQQTGGQATFVPALLQHQQQQAAVARQQAERAQAMQDQQSNWLFQQQWEREHPKGAEQRYRQRLQFHPADVRRGCSQAVPDQQDDCPAARSA